MTFRAVMQKNQETDVGLTRHDSTSCCVCLYPERTTDSLSFLLSLSLSHHRSPSSCCCLQSAWCWTWRAPSCPVRMLSSSTRWRIVNWWATWKSDGMRFSPFIPTAHSVPHPLFSSCCSGDPFIDFIYWFFLNVLISLLNCHDDNWQIHFLSFYFFKNRDFQSAWMWLEVNSSNTNALIRKSLLILLKLLQNFNFKSLFFFKIHFHLSLQIICIRLNKMSQLTFNIHFGTLPTANNLILVA